MILRRLTTAFRKQDWFTVLVEIMIVVLGVFLGLQLGNLNDARAEHDRAIGYLERLVSDLQSDISMYELNFQFKSAAIAEGRFALALTEDPAQEASPFDIVRSFMLASHAVSLTVSDATYSEMISTGDIRLLRNPGLQRALADNYGRVGLNEIVEEFPEYRKTVRGIIPLTAQDYINSACYRSDQIGQYFVSCEARGDITGIEQTARTLRSDPALARQLRYWLSNGGFAVSILADQKQRSIDLLHQVEAAAEAAR